jgi:putative ABC transport system permease protein
MDGFLSDLRYAARSLRRSAGFAAVVIITLTVGTGALTAIFSVVNAVLLRPPPFREPERIVQVWSGRDAAPHGPTSPANFLDWRAATRSFEAVAAEDFAWFNLSGSGDTPPQRLHGALVSPDFFRVMGVQPALGRGFAPDEERSDARVVLLGHSVWMQRFGADRGVVGRSVLMNGERYQVVGVMPAGFDFPASLIAMPVDLYVPLGWAPSDVQRGIRFLGITARLKPGVSLAEARRDVDAVTTRLVALFPRENEALRMRLVPLREELVGASERPLLVLFGAVALVLLIACANVANLMLARARTRYKEVALRSALGADRGRIFRQFFAESALLALAGGALGALAAAWLTDVLVALNPGALPHVGDIGVDGQVLLFALAVAALTALLFGAAPALSVVGASPGAALREAGRSLTAGRDRQRLRSAIVVAEIGMALVLLVGAGLLLRSVDRLLRVDPGFDPARVLAASVALPSPTYAADDRRSQFALAGLERIAATPGVTAAAAIDYLPFSRSDARLTISIEGWTAPRDADFSAHARAVTSGYFDVMRIRLRAGRALSSADRAGAVPAAVVNEAFVRKYWPTEGASAALGRRVRFGRDDDGGPWLTIVGVVGDVKHWALDMPTTPEIYRSLLQVPSAQLSFVVRGASDAAALTAGVRQALLAVDREQPAMIRPMSTLVRASIAEPRFRGVLLATFAGIALILAVVGIYGVISYGVTQRTREIGVRLALGAQRVDVVRLVLREGMLLTACGLGVGLLAAVWLTRLLRGMLFEVTTTDAVTFVGVPILLAATAFVANYLPARRASKVDPLIAIQAE